MSARFWVLIIVVGHLAGLEFVGCLLCLILTQFKIPFLRLQINVYVKGTVSLSLISFFHSVVY